MKKLFVIVLMVASVRTSAQIMTYPTGNVNIKRSTEYSMNVLSVGEENYPSFYTSYKNGVHSKVSNYYNKYNVAVLGDASYSYNLESGRAIGVSQVIGTSG